MLPPLNVFESRYGAIRYVMAPMAGITDVVFRLLMRELGAQMVVSELVSAEGLWRGGQKSRDLMVVSKKEAPVGIQIFGAKVESLVEAARIVQNEGADFVDINLGCPVRKVTSDGGGAAWLKEPLALKKLLVSLRKALSIPLSIKVRTGWDGHSRNLAEIARIAGDAGVDWISVHGRTREQGYSGSADWSLIRDVSQSSPIPIIGNGDVVSASQARSLIDAGYAHGVMIGRGALKQPWIFSEILGLSTKRNVLDVVHRHFELALEWKGRRRAWLSLKKFMGWYAAGYPHSSQFRAKIFEMENVDALRQLAVEYFTPLQGVPRDEDSTPFLMGGHG